MKIIFPIRLQDPRIENILLNTPNLKINKYYSKSISMGVKSFTDLYVMLCNGELKKISNYSSYLENRDKIFYYSLNKFKEEFSSMEEIEKEFNRIYQILDKVKIDNEEGLFQVAKLEMKITSLYYLIENKIENISEEDKKMIIESINKIRDDNIVSELDLVNKTIRNSLPDNEEEIVIEKCIYNGEDIDTSDCLSEIESHKFPQYIKDKDITTTLDDTYEIHTNVCIIRREKGGVISILKKE